VRSSSKQTKSAVTPVAEPKNKENEVEPQHEPAQIEMREQATVLETTSQKERTEA
jgi:hypothetical protein